MEADAGRSLRSTRRTSRRAIAAGLTFRPHEETLRDTLAWRGEDAELATGHEPGARGRATRRSAQS